MVSNIRCSKWYFNTSNWHPTCNEWIKLLSSVSDEERQRVERFVYQDDTKNALIGRALIRKFLSEILNTPSNTLKLARTPRGRPMLVHNPEERENKLIDFNVSHSGDYCVLVGLSYLKEANANEKQSNLRVGIDVMKIVSKNTKHELDRFFDLMKRREFLQKEWSIVANATNDAQKCLNFTRLWCLKESFIKAEGSGLGFGLNRICFDVNNDRLDSSDLFDSKPIIDTVVEIDGHLASNWIFEESRLDQNHLVTIGVRAQEKFSHDSSHDGHQDYLASLKLNEAKFEEIKIDSLESALTTIDEIDETKSWRAFIEKKVKTKS